MPVSSLFEALPDLVLLLRRDGVVLESAGGQLLKELRPAADPTGHPLEAHWAPPVVTLLKQLLRRCIAQRTVADARFRSGSCDYEARMSPQGPDKAICVIRAAGSEDPHEGVEATGERPRPQLDRRGFLKRFKESLSIAALRERPTAVAVIHIDGVTDIAQVIAPKLAEQIMSTAILRLPAQDWWYIGQLSDSLLAVVLESADRDAIEGCIANLCASLKEPVKTAGAEFRLTPYAGVAILGRDASSPRILLDHARSAANEARRAGSARAYFFSDTLKLQSLARLDIARELHEAIANGEIGLRYVGRHDLESGRRIACLAYLRWRHPLRGEIRPVEFVRVAETTGLAMALSRAVLARLREDFATFAAHAEADVTISFGALRHHILHEDFAQDIGEFLKSSGVPPERLELRIAEKTFLSRTPSDFVALSKLGLRLVVDELGRGMGSLDSLARAPLWGLQLDRAWVTALRNDEVARKVCGAGIGLARALGLIPIATGVDDAVQRDALLALGCRYGSGDLYPPVPSKVTPGNP